MLILIIVFSMVFTSSNLSAQPNIAWQNSVDRGGEEYLRDLYYIPGEGFVSCGNSDESMWLLRLDNDGEVVWSEIFFAGVNESIAYSIIQTDNGEFLAGGESNGVISAVLVSGDGDQIWARNYAEGNCYSVIEMKGGDFLLSGRNGDRAYLLCINHDGDVLWDSEFGESDIDVFFGMRETVNGVILCGNSYFRNMSPHHRILVVKSTMDDGELLWQRYLTPEQNQNSYSIVSRPEGGFMISGRGWGYNPYHFVDLMIDNNGNSERLFSCNPEDGSSDWGLNVEKIPPDDYVQVGFNTNGNIRRPVAVRFNRQGVML